MLSHDTAYNQTLKTKIANSVKMHLKTAAENSLKSQPPQISASTNPVQSAKTALNLNIVNASPSRKISSLLASRVSPNLAVFNPFSSPTPVANPQPIIIQVSQPSISPSMGNIVSMPVIVASSVQNVTPPTTSPQAVLPKALTMFKKAGTAAAAKQAQSDEDQIRQILDKMMNTIVLDLETAQKQEKEKATADKPVMSELQQIRVSIDSILAADKEKEMANIQQANNKKKSSELQFVAGKRKRLVQSSDNSFVNMNTNEKKIRLDETESGDSKNEESGKEVTKPSSGYSKDCSLCGKPFFSSSE